MTTHAHLFASRLRRVFTNAGPPDEAPGHAPGHRHLGPPAEERMPDLSIEREPPHDRPWVPDNGLADKVRRSPRE